MGKELSDRANRILSESIVKMKKSGENKATVYEHKIYASPKDVLSKDDIRIIEEMGYEYHWHTHLNGVDHTIRDIKPKHRKTEERVKWYLEQFKKCMPEVKRQIKVYEKSLKEKEEKGKNEKDV